MTENLALLRASAEGAAFNFNLAQLAANLGQLSSRAVYLVALLPALLYGFFVSVPRTREGQKSSVLLLLITMNLVWFIVASIGWIRYAFLGLTLSSIFIARLFSDITDGFKFDWSSGYFRSLFEVKNAARFALTLWLVVIIMVPMAKNVVDIAAPGPNNAKLMADYINENVPQAAVIETWDPEMGFITDHNYHYPQNALLAVAVDQVYYGGEPVQERYDFIQTEKPEYILLGEFSKWTAIYPADYVEQNYRWLQTFGDYDLYQRIGTK